MKLSAVSYQRSAISLVAVIVGVWLCVCQTASAQSTNAPARLSYDSFRAVSDRNIFNPNRYARGSGRTTAPRTSSTPASRVESFSLVGIMAYESGVFAFFDGTKSDYKLALKTDGKIGEYTVAEVTPEHVTITESTNNITLKVGMQMRREDEGDWFLSEGGDSGRKRIVSTRSRTRSSNYSNDHSTAANGETTGGEPEVIVLDSEAISEEAASEGTNTTAEDAGTTDPVLLRLMQRRQQMNQ